LEFEGKFGIGAITSIALNYAWLSWPESRKFKLELLRLTTPVEGEPEKSPLAFLEHYHFGLLSIIIGKIINSKLSPYLYGFGSGLIFSEVLGDHPFGIGKSEYEVRGNIILGSILFGLLLAVW